MARIAADIREGWTTPVPDQGVDGEGVRFITDVADDTITPGFAEDLEKFYKHASEPDQRRCLELLASLSLGDELTAKVQKLQAEKASKRRPGRSQRPKTAMATVGRPGFSRSVKQTETSYRRDFPRRPAPPASQARPKSTQGFYHSKYKLSGPVGEATYTNQYYDKGFCKPALIPSGTASGGRRNNPHPFESFMVWRFPKHLRKGQNIYSGSPLLTDQIMEEILRDKSKSTYQSDYLGIPQGHQVSSAFDKYRDWREAIPHSLDSTMRFSYQYPRQPAEILENNTSRFGCNNDKHIPASGIVPTSQRHQMKIRRNTTYDRFFNQPFKPGTVELNKAIQQGKLDEYLRLANEKERDVLLKMLATMHSTDQLERCRTPSTAGRPLSANVPKPTPPRNSGISRWNGPR